MERLQVPSRQTGSEYLAPSSANQVILVVDDDEAIRDWFEVYLSEQGYHVELAASGHEALDKVATVSPHLILLDIIMPVMDGFEFASRLKNDPLKASIPIIMITCLDDRQARLRGLEAGADEFLAKPVDKTELLVRVRNLLRIKIYNDELAQHNYKLQVEVEQKTREIREHCIDTVLALMRAAEFRDEATGTHVARISHYSTILCDRLGLERDFREQMFYASPMHDIGKLAIPDSILVKPSGFNDYEWSIMKTHTVLGKKILTGATSPYLKMGADIALYHHECWDGSGYPYGLTEEEIPLSARIMTVCDVYDALRSKRPYKEPLDHATVVEIMRKGDSRTCPERFDPAVLHAFYNETERFAAVYHEYQQRPLNTS